MAVVLVTLVSLTAGQTLGQSIGASGSKPSSRVWWGQNFIELTLRKDKAAQEAAKVLAARKPKKPVAAPKESWLHG
ncbi:hypothetical protein PCASD_00156 [Puccinia coronata f. sp. avenae]|uniref:Uncharacterized protein n=1 Tax=Puccinia coronata f. sp. avenae TaxID=200324 RepID=A0A2N5VQV4_9BASI|nr:hypothetical protein PCASD_00156 [Puccinia coronata f. sp. avenae]